MHYRHCQQRILTSDKDTSFKGWSIAFFRWEHLPLYVGGLCAASISTKRFDFLNTIPFFSMGTLQRGQGLVVSWTVFREAASHWLLGCSAFTWNAWKARTQTHAEPERTLKGNLTMTCYKRLVARSRNWERWRSEKLEDKINQSQLVRVRICSSSRVWLPHPLDPPYIANSPTRLQWGAHNQPYQSLSTLSTPLLSSMLGQGASMTADVCVYSELN